MSLDADAMISLQTLRLFNQQYSRDCLSPVSSYGNAVYHYVVKTFAVENGCQHLPDDVEGFGRTLMSLCGEMKRILTDEPRHGNMSSPCYVFGDLHGNFRDLFYFMDNLISFQDLRYTPHRFLFLGDYVDRGEFSVEVIAYLFSMKVLAPSKILLLRGNHEDTLVSGDISGYGSTSFRAQCHGVFGSGLGEQVWRTCSGVFALLPLTANIDHKIYCTHGGIPRYHGGADDRLDLLKSNDFPVMESFFQVPEKETPQHQMFRQVGMDTCWADPAENEGKLDNYGFGSNPRGTGVILFGSKAVDDFLDHFGYEYIFRAHQEKSDGLKLSKNARVFTIFSTSAYVGHSNGAGVVLVADNKIRLNLQVRRYL
ncbi:protein phosphatase [Angomonas deanei]|nr:protein phosphatase [Angomonas deanei]|eukprot:EPY37437.1 protein phosphatase [Angomonas deanei]